MTIAIQGVGITSSIGQGKTQFTDALLAGKTAFGELSLTGRSHSNISFIGAEIGTFSMPSRFESVTFNQLSRVQKIALVTLEEAWRDAQLDQQDSSRIGLFVAGSNFQQRELHQVVEHYSERPFFIDPSYAMRFMDSDLVGLCTELFPIRGASCTIGGASSSGQVAIIQAIQNLRAGLVETAIVLAPFMDLSLWEYQAFRSIGAMGSDRYKDNPQKASRPFDSNRDGFVYGESCGALVLQKAVCPGKYGEISAWAACMDGNRKPHSSVAGERKVMLEALSMAGLASNQIDYINPHGSGSVSGDIVELDALRSVGLLHADINATKSVTGHGLSAAGLVEVIATVLQMEQQTLHPSLNLEMPIDDEFNWVRGEQRTKNIQHALSLSYGFGGFNTALCLKAP